MNKNKSVHFHIGEADAHLWLLEAGIRRGVESECREAQLIGYIDKLKELMDMIHEKATDKINAF